MQLKISETPPPRAVGGISQAGRDFFSPLPAEILSHIINAAAAMGVPRATLMGVSQQMRTATIKAAGNVLMHAFTRQVALQQPVLSQVQYLALQEAAALLGDSTEVCLREAGPTALEAALQAWCVHENQHEEEDRSEAARRILQGYQIGAATLDLSELGLTTLPDALWQLTALETLFLSANPLNVLSKELGRLVALTFLDLSDTRLMEAPKALGKLTALKFLSLSNTPIASFPKHLGRLTALVNLDLSGTEVTVVPGAIGQLVNLLELRLTDTPLVHISDAIGELSRLRTLCVDGTFLEALPDTLGQLTALSLLEVNKGLLQAWPEGVDHLLE